MNGGWKKETASLHGKLLAWLGGALAYLMAVACGVLICAAAYKGCYDSGDARYYDADGIASCAWNAWQWFEAYYRSDTNGRYDDNPDFAFDITDENGTCIFANEDHAQDNYVGRLRIVQDSGSVGFTWFAADDVSMLSPIRHWSRSLADELTDGIADIISDAASRSEEAALLAEGGDTTDIQTYPNAETKTKDLPDGTYLMNCYLSKEIDLTSPEWIEQARMYRLLNGARYSAVAGLGVSIILGIFCLIFLFCGAGRKPGDAPDTPVHLCWYDRIPLELSLALTAGGIFALGYYALCVIRDAFIWTQGGILLFIVQMAAAGVPAALLVVCWLLGFARWAKTGHAFQNSLLVQILVLIGRGFSALGAVPKTALAAGAVALANLAAYLIFGASSRDILKEGLFIFGIFAWLVVFAVCMLLAKNIKTLEQAIARIAAGDYETSVPREKLLPVFRQDAEALSHIRDGVSAAVERQIKSERLKAELITNVSHDLRTPLTNLINYTDLLQKQPLDETAAEYAAVLAREGEKLKKLTEDLIDASKASSGAMPCHVAAASLSELCEQALGEYAERLSAAGLEPVLSMPENGLYARIDGRLAWRVLDNLLGNACKYAQRGTRVYLAGQIVDDTAVLTVKNVSAAPLNLPAEQLMERFVRGDASRTSEGSGLGLSIARSLTELQGGRFCLTVDGDLFKAEMTFPASRAPEAEPVI